MGKKDNLTKNAVYVISAVVSKAVWIFSLFKMTEYFAEKLNKCSNESSTSGQIRIYDTGIGKSLAANSSAGTIYCRISGNEADYNINCSTLRRDLNGFGTPWHSQNSGAEKKISLHSNVYMPELIFV